MIIRDYKILLIVLSITIVSCSSSKNHLTEKHIFFCDESWSADELETCEFVLSKIPEADSLNIVFVKSGIKSMGQAQPKIKTIFGNPSQRQYTIKLRSCKKNPNLCFETLPDSAKIALVAHEIFHVVDYSNKSFTQILGLGIKYSLSSKYKRRLEWITDSITISQGFGYELLCFTNFIYKSEHVSQKYLKKKKKFYMTPEDILLIIDSN